MRRSHLIAIAVACLALMLTFAGPVAASTGGATVSGVRGYAGVLSWLGDFTASWSVVKANVDGSNVWRVRNISMSSAVRNGKSCGPDNCDSWTAGASVKFLNASGAQVGITIYPPKVGTCTASVYDSNSLHWGWCRTSPYDAPYSATKVKVNWTVGMTMANGFSWVVFNVTKTVPLY
jgi:hypothetical protein